MTDVHNCPSCGVASSADAKFCEFCGAAVQPRMDSVEEPSPPTQQGEVYVSQRNTQPTHERSLNVEKTFLKIARYSLIGVLAVAFVVTVVSAVYGVLRVIPASPTQPQISIKYGNLVENQSTRAFQSDTALSEGSSAATTKSNQKCQDLTAKLNKVSSQVGWEKRTQEVFDPGTRRFINKVSVDFNQTVDQGRFCSVTQKLLDEQNSKLDSYIKNVDLTDTYYSNFNAYLDTLLVGVEQEKALPLDSPNRHYAVDTIRWFNSQFQKSVEDELEKDRAVEERNVLAKTRGLMALYVAGSSFLFFFACCLILVFIRIEVNTREIAESLRSLSNNGSSVAPGQLNGSSAQFVGNASHRN